GGLVTITHVDTTSDLRYAKIYISSLNKENEKEMMKGLRSASGYLRRELGAALRLRYTPELQFIADDSIQQGAHILEMLRDPNVVKPANPANEHIVLEDEK
ncbi:MAG: 30S ribosome-binding factor RbfA, partial [Oscillospiraceae bacterium]|nr:30S ribosome-binding factor RbfA [Oscillospiraceae bacterium]